MIRKLVFILCLFVSANSHSQVVYNIPIGQVLDAGATGVLLPNGITAYAERITMGTGTHDGVSGDWNLDPAPMGGDYNGTTMAAYTGDPDPILFTRIRSPDKREVDNGGNTNYKDAIGFYIHFDAPISLDQFLFMDIDGQEWISVYAFNGDARINPTISLDPTSDLTIISNPTTLNATWDALVDSKVGTTADNFNTGNNSDITQWTGNGGVDPDDIHRQVLADFSSASVTDFFVVFGSVGDLPQGRSNSGMSPLVVTLYDDYGDAPDTYSTTSANNGASHAYPSEDLMLGATVDTEVDAITPLNGTGDGADEDGWLSSTLKYDPAGGITCGSYTTKANEYCAVVSVTNNLMTDPAQLVGWLDFGAGNNFTPDGVFDTAERSLPCLGGSGTGVMVSDSGGGTTCSGTTLGSGNQTFTTGNIEAGFSGNVVLVWTGLGDVDEQSPSQSFVRFRLTTTPSFFSNTSPAPTGPVADGEVEDYLLPVDTLPVTLSHFDSTRRGNKVEVDWSTASELFNVGFQLWGLDGGAGGWTKLHNWLVKSGSGNAVEPQSYRKKVKTPASIDELVALGISSVDTDGSEHYYGPFEIGTRYGDLAGLEPIEWNDIRAETDTSMAANGYVKDQENGYRKASVDSEAALTGDTQILAQFNVSEYGMYRITASELLEAGADMRNVAKRDLAVVDYLGEPVVRDVVARGKGKGGNKTLGDNGEIYVYAKAPDVRAGLYTPTSVYRIIEDSELAREALVQGKQGLDTGFSTQYREEVIVETDKLYILHSAADDPWLQSVVLSYPDQPRGALDYIDLPGDALVDEGVEIIIGAARSSALSGSGVEHLMQGAVIDANGQIVWLETREAVGKGLWEQRFAVPPETVLGDANGQVGVGALFSAGAGYAFSEVHTDYFGLSYVRPTTAKEGEDYLQFDGATEAPGYEVIVPNNGTPQVFASDGVNLVRIVPESSRKIKRPDGTKQRRVKFAALQGTGNDTSVHYWVGSSSGAERIEGLHSKSIVSQDALLAQASGSDLLLIVHPAFMGADTNGLDPVLSYAEFKQSQGVTPTVLNYLDIVDTFGGGQNGPHGLTVYLHQLEARFGVDNVLIVGGSTYDHTNHLNTGAITFIPAHYGVSGYSNFTTSDVPYITGTDQALFATIGRWPVRSRADLAAIVDKSILWSTRDHTNGSALLIGEHTLDGEAIDFSAALDGLEPILPAQWSTHKVYVEQVTADNGLTLPGDLTQALSLSKAQIIDELNTTPALVLYNGHASTRQLSNWGLFKAGDIAQVTNEGAEIWLPLSCYVTFYESTHVNTLAHQLLFTGNAVNISGAMLLSKQSENVAMGEAILSAMMTDNTALGGAVNAAKATQNNPQLTINWALLGDPTIRPKP